MTEDSVKLLRECDAGLKMAIYDLDNIKHGVGKAFMRWLFYGNKSRNLRSAPSIRNPKAKAMFCITRISVRLRRNMSPWLKKPQKKSGCPSALFI